mmetsp:Transcript_13585/g.29433  ORF Transcript_13585/g.29433 Transcript_13585/m.29433 type:complete len:80 (-) Transcript_13585:531-770(-)
MSTRTQVLACYRDLQRKLRLLPSESQSYYASYLRQQFNSHRELDEPESNAADARVRSMLDRARQSADWILRKYDGGSKQ